MGVIGKRQMIMTGNGASVVTPPSATNALLIVFNGESNSVGYAANSDALVSELGARQNIQILNKNTLVFEQLNIGVNNDFEVTANHGWELELANEINSTGIGTYNSCYLVKTGQGGTKISDWAVGGTWFTRMQTRMTAALNALTALGKTPKILWWYSQGINDVGTTANIDWYNGTIAHFAAVRALYGSTLPILMTKFTAPHTKFNTDIDTIANADPYTVAIDATGCAKNPDDIHWNYAGNKLLTSRFITETMNWI